MPKLTSASMQQNTVNDFPAAPTSPGVTQTNPAGTIPTAKERGNNAAVVTPASGQDNGPPAGAHMKDAIAEGKGADDDDSKETKKRTANGKGKAGSRVQAHLDWVVKNARKPRANETFAADGGQDTTPRATKKRVQMSVVP